ncbi:MAG: hypothetical protein RMA76_43600 [Deltaproteobacteria bacterium]|jgi:hypothetical protein
MDEITDYPRLASFCDGANPAGMSREQIYENCVDLWQAFYPTTSILVGLGILAAVSLIYMIIFRVARGDATGTTVATCFEVIFYVPGAAYAGASGGLLLAQLLHPFAAASLIFLAVAVALFIMVKGLIDAASSSTSVGGGWIFLGIVEIVLVAGALAVTAAFAAAVNETNAAAEYETYYQWMYYTFGGIAAIHALYITSYRSFHAGIAWLLIPLGATWGLIGTLLGTFHHIASSRFKPNHGQPAHGLRSLYTKYTSGFNLKGSFGFTLGSTMFPGGVEKHESIHVLQHFVFGPSFELTYMLWAIVFFIPALIASPIVGYDVGKGIEAYCYYNNPWETMAYAVDGAGKPVSRKKMIFNDHLRWALAVIWWQAGAIGLVIFALFRAKAFG